MRPFLLAALAILVLPAAALAGGFATAGLSSTPEGVQPGEPWAVDVTILQHGRTPMTDVEPAVIIKGGKGTQKRFAAEQRFAAEKTSTPGVYRAVVTFPEAGRWSYEVDDGFTNAVPHTFPAVTISASGAPVSSGASGSESPWWPLLLLAPVLAGAAALLLRRRGGAGASQLPA